MHLPHPLKVKAIAEARIKTDKISADILADLLRAGLLERSSIIEQRSFLKSFVDRIEMGDSEVNMYYTIPVPPI